MRDDDSCEPERHVTIIERLTILEDRVRGLHKAVSLLEDAVSSLEKQVG